MTQRRRANFFTHQTRHHGDIETNNTTAHPQQRTAETGITTAPKKPHQKHPFLTRKGDAGFNPTQPHMSKGDTGFRQPAAWSARPDCGPMGGGRAGPDNEPTRRATHQRHKPHWCEGHRRDRRAWLRCPWAAAGPGRASRSTTPSRRLACGDLAGGQPPTGTPSSPAQTWQATQRAENPWGLKRLRLAARLAQG